MIGFEHVSRKCSVDGRSRILSRQSRATATESIWLHMHTARTMQGCLRNCPIGMFPCPSHDERGCATSGSRLDVSAALLRSSKVVRRHNAPLSAGHSSFHSSSPSAIADDRRDYPE